MSILFTLFCFFLSTLLLAQEKTGNIQLNYRVEYSQQAHFPGGDSAFYKHMSQNIQYNEEAFANKLFGEVMISFEVLSDSTLCCFIPLSQPGYGIEKEVIRVLSAMKFVPAVANGFPVRQNLIISVPVRAQHK